MDLSPAYWQYCRRDELTVPPLTLKVIAKAAMMWNMTGLSDRVLHQMPMGMDEIATANAIDANMDAHTGSVRAGPLTE